ERDGSRLDLRRLARSARWSRAVRIRKRHDSAGLRPPRTPQLPRLGTGSGRARREAAVGSLASGLLGARRQRHDARRADQLSDPVAAVAAVGDHTWRSLISMVSTRRSTARSAWACSPPWPPTAPATSPR